MSSSKQKRDKSGSNRADRKAAVRDAELREGLERGTIIVVDRSKVVSRSVLPRVPEYYRDTWFACKDCGTQELWTAKQQRHWHEDQGGEIEAVAVRCRACRWTEKIRREAARKVHLDGIAKKRTGPA